LTKRKVLDCPDQYHPVFVAKISSLYARRECLELFLDYLPRRYPDLYRYNEDSKSIIVTAIQLEDYWDTNPLELCARIVQEDLVLMRSDCQVSDKIIPYFMAAAAVVYSFDQLKEKL